MIGRLVSALKAEFKGTGVVLHLSPTDSIKAPSVVVTPGSPFLTPGTHGSVEERWDVLVIVSTASRSAGVDRMRDVSLRVRRAASLVGAHWVNASQPMSPVDRSQTYAIVINEVAFRFDPDVLLSEESTP